MAKSRQLQKSYRSTRETPTEVLDLIEKSEIPFSKLVDQSIVCYMNLEREKNGEAPIAMTSSSGGDMTPVFDAIHSDGEMTRDMLRDINNKVKVLAKYMKKSVIEQRQEHDADEQQQEAEQPKQQTADVPVDAPVDVPADAHQDASSDGTNGVLDTLIPSAADASQDAPSMQSDTAAQDDMNVDRTVDAITKLVDDVAASVHKDQHPLGDASDDTVSDDAKISKRHGDQTTELSSLGIGDVRGNIKPMDDEQGDAKLSQEALDFLDDLIGDLHGKPKDEPAPEVDVEKKVDSILDSLI